MTANEATKRSPTDDDLPEGFSAAVSESGRTYYLDHTNKSTSWIHPRGPQLCEPLTLGLPYPYERDFDKKGRAYYLNHDTRKTSWLSPVKLAELEATGILDAEMDELVTKGMAGDSWPWIVKETVESGPRQGEGYWVDYRRGTVCNRSPEDIKAGYLATTHIREARERKNKAGRDAKL